MCTELDIENLLILGKRINLFLSSKNKECTLRYRKTNMFDGVSFAFQCGRKDISQDIAAAKLVVFIEKSIKRQSLVAREKSINISIYKSIYEILDTFGNEFYYNKFPIQVIAVDGVQANLSGTLTKDGYLLTKNGSIVNALTLGLYNTTYNFPISLELAKNKNEREAFIYFIQNTDKYKGWIFLFDRGFVDKNLFKMLDEKGIKYVCRIRDNSLCISKDSNDEVVLYNGNKMRVIRYTLKKKEYYLATNLFDSKEYPIIKLKELYHKRWRIEEYFKYIKKYMKFDNMTEHRQSSLMKTIYVQLITSRIIDLLAHIIGANPNRPKAVVNKALLTEGVYNDFLLRLIYNKEFTKEKINSFFTTYANYVSSQAGKHYVRKAIRPTKKWYVKSYQKKFTDIKEKLQEEKRKKKKEVKKLKKQLLEEKKRDKKELKELKEKNKQLEKTNIQLNKLKNTQKQEPNNGQIQSTAKNKERNTIMTI
jgi:hypothetical protein